MSRAPTIINPNGPPPPPRGRTYPGGGPPDNRLRRPGLLDTYLHHGAAQRTNTDNVVYASLAKFHPNTTIRIVPEFSANILAYGAAGHADVTPAADGRRQDGEPVQRLKWTMYVEPETRIDGEKGTVVEKVLCGRFDVLWKGVKFVLYVVEGRDGVGGYPIVKNNYLIEVEEKGGESIDEFVLAVGAWMDVLHGEVWVFDSSSWQKDGKLFESVKKARWENVILDEGMKKDIVGDINRFFDGRKTYGRLKVPWKRGLIFHGPPGNGKTISIKAIMHMLYERKEPVPTLYVKTLNGFLPPENALSEIFTKARKTAPCFLVFEDLDSVVTDRVRSYFLNQVDGIAANDGILMVGSTNHLELLDPGIAKRPSRFDRKYLYPNPNFEQRVKYAQFWRQKLLADNSTAVEPLDEDDPDNLHIDFQDDPLLSHDDPHFDFPEEMCKAVAEITDKFSFAYMQEAFVASLLAIATNSGQDDSEGESDGFIVLRSSSSKVHDGLDEVVLWKEFKKQVKILKDQLDPDESSS